MYKITVVQTRPNLSVDFWTKDHPALTAEYLEYYRNTYIITGKHLAFNTDVSVDSLSLTTVMTWDSEASANAWKQDPTCVAGFFELQSAHFEATGISVSRTTEEI